MTFFRATETVNIIPGFSPTGRRAAFSYGEGASAVECAMSYSALGDQMEAWRFTIRRSPWSWACIIESASGSKLRFSFYSITFSGGGGSAQLSSVELWGPEGVYARNEHYVLPQGLQVRNAAGWVSGLVRVSLARMRAMGAERQTSSSSSSSSSASKRQQDFERDQERWRSNAKRKAQQEARKAGHDNVAENEEDPKSSEL